MKTILRCFVIWLLICASINVKAQDLQTSLNLPNITPPAPTAQNFMRYGEIPVDYSTGVPGISIPIYTVKSRQLSLPISISYHASGIKVDDKSSVIGLGWVLNCGGLITETILDKDGAGGSYKTSAAFNAARAALEGDQTNLSYWGDQMMREKSSYGWKSSRYFYQLPNGESGIFRYDFVTGNLIKLPYTPTKIGPYTAGTGLNNFTITDEKGVTYTFNLPPGNGGNGIMTTLNLTSIVSADKTDTIRLVYKTGLNMFFAPNYTTVLQLADLPSIDQSNGAAVTYTPTATFTNSISLGYQTYEQILDSVITTNTVVKFTAASDRQDMSNGTGKYRVNNISIYDRSSSQLIKSYAFSQDYFGTSAANNQRLRLNGMTVSGSDEAAVEHYSFVYDTTATLPPYPENLGGLENNKFQEDYWGYYNGSASNSMIPYQFVPGTIPPYETTGTSTVSASYSTNRNPDSLYGKAAMLKEIHYPTGGKTVFAFEPNRAANAYLYPSGFTAPTYVGGFRIKNISNYTATGTLADYKAYTYSQGQTRMITSDLYAQIQRTVTELLFTFTFDSASPGQVSYTNSIFSSSPYLPLICDHGPPVFYSSVTEYTGNGLGGNIGKTVYNYRQPTATPDSMTYVDFEGPVYLDPYAMDIGNYEPKLLSKTDYKYVSSTNSYTPVKSLQNSYTTYLDTAYHMGMHLVNMSAYVGIDEGLDYKNIGLYDTYLSMPYGWQSLVGGANYFIAKDVMAEQVLQLPTQSVAYDYNTADSTKFKADTTTYAYGSLAGYTLGSPVHLQPTQKTVQNSIGDRFFMNLKYPQDFPAAAVYDTMVNRNILNPVIQQSNYKNGTGSGNFLNAVTTNYNAWTSHTIEPQTVQTQTGSAPVQTRITYSAYDGKANVTQVSKTGGPQVSYLWGYKQTYPIAQATNAPVNDIFYDGFEEGDGNSSSAKTGHYSKTGGYSTTLTGLDPGNYILSYWSKPAGAWVLQRSVVSVTGSAGSSSYSISISGQIDDICFYPANAQMTTFTYDPLVGKTSVTDPKGDITYYEYDTFQRLKNIRDKDGNIIKNYCYNYAGQSTTCPILLNIPQSTASTNVNSFVTSDLMDKEWKQDPPPGYTIAADDGTTINAAHTAGTNAGRFAYFATGGTLSPLTQVNGNLSFTAKGSGTIEVRLIASYNTSVVYSHTFNLTPSYQNFSWDLTYLYPQQEMIMGVIVNGGAASQASVQFQKNFTLNLQQCGMTGAYTRFRADSASMIGNAETGWYGWNDNYGTPRKKYLQHSAYARMRFQTSATKIAIEYVRDFYNKNVVNLFSLGQTQNSVRFDTAGRIVAGYTAVNSYTQVTAGHTYTISGLLTTEPLYVWYNGSTPMGPPQTFTNYGTSVAPVYQITAPPDATNLALLVQNSGDLYFVYTQCMVQDGAIGASSPNGTIPSAYTAFSGYVPSHISGPAVFINGQLYKYYDVEQTDIAKVIQFVTDTLPAGNKTVEVMMPGQGTYLPTDPHERRAGTYLRAVYFPGLGTAVAPSTTVDPGSILYVHDSILSGYNISSDAQNNVWMMKTKTDPSFGFTGDIYSEGYAGRILWTDISTPTLTTQFAAKLASYGVNKYWFQIGVNDWSFLTPLPSFYTQYKSLIEQLQTLRPAAKIYIQSIGPVIFEGPNAETYADDGLTTTGPTANDYRDVQRALATSHSNTEYVNFEGLFSPTAANLSDGIHPTDAGNLLYANGIKNNSTLLGTVLAPASLAFYRSSSRHLIRTLPGIYIATATGGTAPYAFTLQSGTLPTGLSFNGDGTITGTPSVSGTYLLSIKITDATSAAVTKTDTLIVDPTPTITVTPIAEHNISFATPHNITYNGAGGYGPYTLAQTSGTLPPGMTFDASTHILSGTPTTTGTYTFTLNATDQRGFSGASVDTVVIVTPPPPLPASDTYTVTATVNSSNHLILTPHLTNAYTSTYYMYTYAYYMPSGGSKTPIAGQEVPIASGSADGSPVDMGGMALNPGSFSIELVNSGPTPSTLNGGTTAIHFSDSTTMSLSTTYTSPSETLTYDATINSSGHLMVRTHLPTEPSQDIYAYIGAAINGAWLSATNVVIPSGSADSPEVDFGLVTGASGNYSLTLYNSGVSPGSVDGKFITYAASTPSTVTKP